ncbi:glutathione S-transferase domain-containing protein [Pseudomonas sp. M47T1]|uniref:glutathione S-transferase family protein n=1 Tax=unclassified Pseudomonas TaxID=196821 RepID=UPI0002608332|nr:glutathione S-transferase family protein [Pseudomonas sp. M47T1]EIK95383.1 glutathione S-transferase domain-containing protein [Pseudomonas sp. M47T1]
MTELVLFNAGISTCSQRVRFVLAHKRLAYTDQRLRLDQGQHLAPEYLAINPNGLVPSLTHDGQVIVDSSVINEYLDEVFPETRLVPALPVQRAHMRAWVAYLDEVMTPAIRYPSFQQFFGGGLRNMSDEQRQGFANRLPLRKHFALEVGPQGFAPEKLEGAMERIEQSLDRMELALADKPWIAHQELTLADIAMMPSIVRLEDLGLTSLWDQRPNVANWYTRLQDRPAFAAAYGPGSRLGAHAN